MAPPSRVRAVLLDVEGTTTPVTFVKQVLFPHAEARLAAFCAGAGRDPRAAAALQALLQEHRLESSPDRPAFGDGAAYARWLMAQDRKSTGLKALQGLIWEAGYRAGQLRAPVFPDVPRAFAGWRAAGLRISIFSSGSVLAQRLLFAHTDHGDLTGWIEGYYDTETGPKHEAGSYSKIAAALDLAPPDVLFLSDSPEELAAARSAGMATARIDRPGHTAVTPDPGSAYCDFTPLLP